MEVFERDIDTVHGSKTIDFLASFDIIDDSVYCIDVDEELLMIESSFKLKNTCRGEETCLRRPLCRDSCLPKIIYQCGPHGCGLGRFSQINTCLKTCTAPMAMEILLLEVLEKTTTIT